MLISRQDSRFLRLQCGNIINIRAIKRMHVDQPTIHFTDGTEIELPQASVDQITMWLELDPN